MEDKATNSEVIRRIRRLKFLRREKRRHDRKACYINVNYVVQERSYSDVANNISEGGACLRTKTLFFSGDEILLDFSFLGMRTHVVGRIAWSGPQGIGIEFKSVRAEAKGIRYDFDFGEEGVIRTEKEVLKMGKVRERTVRWEPSADAKKYRLYWSNQGPVGYDSDFVEVENNTKVVLPDEVPSFPMIAGNIELGITAVSAAGNESDITKANAYVDFTIPESPKALTVED